MEMEHLARVKKDLNKVSPSFCLAKWLQVTMHLQNGFNHSCHHPNLHKIPLEELKKNPSALHNTAYKKEQRRLMLAGERPAECNYCWGVEDTKGSHYSDRILKSSDPWAQTQLKEIATSPFDQDINPTYVEVSFGSQCNFRCSYCNPYTSSLIWAHYEKHGPYVARESLESLVAGGKKPYAANENNPYVEAFWRWFPEATKALKVFRITGGEPLVNPNTFLVLDYLDKNPVPHLELCINSNLGIHDRFFDEMLEKVGRLSRDGKIGKFNLFTSVDTYGAQAGYLRVGLNYEKWRKNVVKYLEHLPWNLTFMVTYNLLSPPKFPALIDDLAEINRELFGTGRNPLKKRTYMDISHLTHPEYFSAWILTPEWREKIAASVPYMAAYGEDRIGPAGFEPFEVHKLERISSWVNSLDWRSQGATQHRKEFALFTEQFEEREKVNFLSLFPEMEGFLQFCKDDSAARVNP